MTKQPGLIWSLLASLLLLAAATALATEAEEQNNATVMEFFMTDPAVEFPESAPLLVNARGREYHSLNGKWDIIVDEAGIGWRVVTQGNYYPPGVRYPATGMTLQEHSFDERKQLMVPGDWNNQIPQLDRYRGKVLYHRQVNVQRKADSRYYIHFDGANYVADLFVNGEIVGRHRGGYTAFNFDITDFLVDGQNTLVVRVDAHLDDTTIPTMRTSDFWKYGGLIRDVGIVVVPQTHISQYHVYLADHASKEIRGWVQLAGDRVSGRTVKIRIREAGINLITNTDRDGRAEFAVKAPTLELWSPESPRLYNLALTLDGVPLEDRIGFRTIATQGSQILLNGQPIRLRGISMHDESVLHRGLANSAQDARASLALVKQLNANFVRLAHYPHNEYTVRLADELGLMLWSEVPIVSLIDWQNPDTLALAKAQVADNISRDMNRAAIIMWSVSNESFPQTDARLAFLGELAATARHQDASKRPIASALVGNPQEEFRDLGKHLVKQILATPGVDAKVKEKLMAMAAPAAVSDSPVKDKAAQEEVAAQQPPSQPAATQQEPPAVEEAAGLNVVVSDPLGEVVDIVGYNEYFGWYYEREFARALGVDEGIVRDAMLAIMPSFRFSNSFGKPMIISEFGADAKQGLRSDKAYIYSEDYQARVYRAQLAMLEQSAQVQGYSPWVLKDFRSHLRELNGIQDGYNRKGLVSETGKKKLAFEVLANHYKAVMGQVPSPQPSSPP